MEITTDGNHTIEYYSTDQAGNTEEVNIAYALLDREAPTTSAIMPEGWQNSDFNIDLNASDSLSGIMATYYRVDSGEWVSGSSVLINTDGNHQIEFYSVDDANNIETSKTVFAALDKTLPEFLDYNISSHKISPNASLLILADVNDLTSIQARAYIQRPDENNVVELTMFDDGNHSDGAADDNLFGVTWNTAGFEEGIYMIDLNAIDEAGNSSEIGNILVVLSDENVSLDVNSKLAINASTTFMACDANLELDINVADSVENVFIGVVRAERQIEDLGSAIGLRDLNVYVSVIVSESLIQNLNVARLKLHYDESDVNNAGTDENELLLYKWSSAASRWLHPNEYALAYGVDTNNNYVWVDVNSFSHFLLASDDIAPVIGSFTTSKTSAEVGDTITFTLQEANSETGLNARITIGSVVTNAAMTDNGDGTYSYSWNTSTASAGSYSVWVSLTDSAGNSTNNSAEPLTITLTQPVAPTPTPTTQTSSGSGGIGAAGGGAGSGALTLRYAEDINKNRERIEKILVLIESYGLKKTQSIEEGITRFNDINFDQSTYATRKATEIVLDKLPELSQESFEIALPSVKFEFDEKKLPLEENKRLVPLDNVIINSEITKSKLTYKDLNETVLIYHIKRALQDTNIQTGYLLEKIPKTVIEKANDLNIKTSKSFTIVEEDPIIAWAVSESDPVIEYGFISDEEKDLATIELSVYAVEEEVKKTPATKPKIKKKPVKKKPKETPTPEKTPEKPEIGTAVKEQPSIDDGYLITLVLVAIGLAILLLLILDYIVKHPAFKDVKKTKPKKEPLPKETPKPEEIPKPERVPMTEVPVEDLGKPAREEKSERKPNLEELIIDVPKKTK
jgi:hypothetical protein